jgi:hypothetical protein
MQEPNWNQEDERLFKMTQSTTSYELPSKQKSVQEQTDSTFKDILASHTLKGSELFGELSQAGTGNNAEKGLGPIWNTALTPVSELKAPKLSRGENSPKQLKGDVPTSTNSSILSFLKASNQQSSKDPKSLSDTQLESEDSISTSSASGLPIYILTEVSPYGSIKAMQVPEKHELFMKELMYSSKNSPTPCSPIPPSGGMDIWANK